MKLLPRLKMWQWLLLVPLIIVLGGVLLLAAASFLIKTSDEPRRHQWQACPLSRDAELRLLAGH